MAYQKLIIRALLIIVLVVALLGVIIWCIQNQGQSQNNIQQSNQTSNLVFQSTKSTPNHPVFVSQQFHFTYSPVGNFGLTVSESRGSQQLVASITDNTTTNAQNLSLEVYRNNHQLAVGQVDAFRAWRKENIYDHPSDPITTLQVSGYQLYKATQVDGLESQSTYYYLVQPDYIFVFIETGTDPDRSIRQALANFHLN